MRDDRCYTDEQLRRQSIWLKDSWDWLLKTKVLTGELRDSPHLNALDVGCGPGHVMELLATNFNVTGVDRDMEKVQSARLRGLQLVQADAYDLPYEDDSFDLVYCSFLMLWLDDPVKAIGEMKRVAKHWVACLAEPDYGGRIDHPAELTELTKYLAIEIKRLGGDPFIGRKLRAFFNQNGIEGEVGAHQGVWSVEMLRQQAEQEWVNIKRAADGQVDNSTLRKGKAAWEEALGTGDLFQFNPVFYAFGRKV